MEKIYKILINAIIITIITGILLFGFNFNSDKCSQSRFNPSNVSGGSYIFGKCYVPYYGTYTSTTKCGFLGISCDYDTKPYVKMSSGSLCFRLKDGKRC